MNGLALFALAAVLLGAGLVGISIGSALQVHRLNVVDARLDQLEEDSHTHDFLGSKPRLSQTFVTPVTPTVPPRPVSASLHVNTRQPWDGAGWQS